MQPQTCKEPPQWFTVACSPLLLRTIMNKLPSTTAKYLKFWLILPEHLLPFFCTPVPVFSCIFKLLGLVSVSEVWLFGCSYSMNTTSGQTSADSRWVYPGPTGFCQFWTDDTAGNLLISKGNKPNVFFKVSFVNHCVYDPQRCPFPYALLKRAWTAHLETPVCFEISVCERPRWCSTTTLCLVDVLSLAMVYDLWHQTVFHNLTLVAEFGCSSPILKPPTQLFLFQLITVFQPTCEIDDYKHLFGITDWSYTWI